MKSASQIAKKAVQSKKNSDTYYLDELPADVQQIIFGYLTEQEVKNSIGIIRYANRFFEYYSPVYELRRMLKFISACDIANAEKILNKSKSNHALYKFLLCNDESVTDSQGRFFRASAFKLSLWMLNRKGWEMLLPHLDAVDPQEAGKQILSLESRGLTYNVQQVNTEEDEKHEVSRFIEINEIHYNFNVFFNAYSEGKLSSVLLPPVAQEYIDELFLLDNNANLHALLTTAHADFNLEMYRDLKEERFMLLDEHNSCKKQF